MMRWSSVGPALLAVVVVSTVLAALLVASVATSGKSGEAGAEPRTYVTSCNAGGSLEGILQPGSLLVDKDLIPAAVISINTADILQPIVGYGAGLPQSSAYVLALLKDSDYNLYHQVMGMLFSPKEGAGLSFLRFPMASCDFSMSNTSYDETDGDYALNDFAIDPDSQYIICILKDAISLNPLITLMATPWSAPSWMKPLDTLLGMEPANTLINTTAVYESYGNYFKRTIDSFNDEGLPIRYISLQNEPLFGDNKQYPGMYLNSQDESKLGSVVKRIVGDAVGILAYDHNWDVPEYALDVLKTQRANNETNFEGTAWHCYAGDMATALDQLSDQFPELPQHITECTAGFPDDECDIARGMDNFCWDHEWDMKNLFLGAAAHGASSGTKWIMALDENCGPTLPTVTWKSGRPFVSIPSDAKSLDDIKFNQDYYTTSHMSKYIKPGSFRVKSVTSGSNSSVILSESFFNEDSGKLITIVMNLDHKNDLDVQILINDIESEFMFRIPLWSTVILEF